MKRNEPRPGFELGCQVDFLRQKRLRQSHLSGRVANALGCDIVVSLNFSHAIMYSFVNNTFGKIMNYLSPHLWIK